MFFFNTYNFLEAIFVLSQVRYFYSGTLEMLWEMEKKKKQKEKGKTHILYHFHTSDNGYFHVIMGIFM